MIDEVEICSPIFFKNHTTIDKLILSDFLSCIAWISNTGHMFNVIGAESTRICEGFSRVLPSRMVLPFRQKNYCRHSHAQ